MPSRQSCRPGILARLLSATLLLLLTTAASGNSKSADEHKNDALSDEFLSYFIERYRADPGALGKYLNRLRHASTEQMRQTVAGLDTTHFTYLYPMVIPAHDLAELNGTSLDRLSLMAVRGDRLIPVPFQFDEYDQGGLIWIEEKRADPAGKPGQLDGLDELVFMFRDAGTQRFDAQRHELSEGRLVKEITLDDQSDKPRYVYLVMDNSLRSEVSYVDVDLEHGRMTSTVVEMGFDPKNLAGINHVAARIGPHQGENVFDNIYMQLSTGILNRNLRLSLDTRRNIRAVPMDVRQGPVRATVQLRARIWYFGLPTLVSHDFNMQFYEQGVVIPTQFAIDSIGAMRYLLGMLREPRLEFQVDFHDLEGATVTYASVYHPDKHGLVDGEMSAFEDRMNQVRMPGDWLHMDSGRGWQLFFHNRIPLTEGGLFDQFLDGTSMAMVYLDDARLSDDHKQFTGTLPRLGFRSTGLPEGAIELLSASPRLPRDIETLGDAIYFLADEDQRSRMNRYDEAANRVLSQLRDSGAITSAEDLAEAFVTDMGRMRFTGLPRDQLDGLIRDAIIASVEDPGAVNHAEVLAKMVNLAEQRDIALRQLRHATIDNALWFPDSTGPGGPTRFYAEVSNPPGYRITPAGLGHLAGAD